jgi:hypothetical protein
VFDWDSPLSMHRVRGSNLRLELLGLGGCIWLNVFEVVE